MSTGAFDVKRVTAPDPPSRDEAGSLGERFRRVLAALVRAPIRLYQRVISPGLPRRCKYHPTCSQYALDAIREVGVIRGMVLAGWRLLRCNPFSDGGYDPVERRSLFRSASRSKGLGA